MGLNRAVILCVVSALSFVLPAAVCGAVAAAPVASWLDAALVVVAASAWMSVLALVNWWEFTSIHLRWAWFGVLAVVSVERLFDALGLPLVAGVGGLAVAAGLAAAAGLWLVGGALSARRPGDRAIDLAFPLSDGNYLVTDGGDGTRSFLVNYHYGFRAHRASGVNASMRYALDVVAIGRWGGESRGLLPRRNDAYHIWHRPVSAPCDGRVVRVVNDVKDNDAFGSNRPYGVGNHVVLLNGDVYFVAGHLAEGSVRVTAGQDVREGEVIALVGNSGWTERPHVHMQAMRSTNGDFWHGTPVPVRFAGRFPVRNQVVRTVTAGTRR
jgi:hypothetical protein